MNGDLQLDDHAAVRGNLASGQGGGVNVGVDGTLTMLGRSRITANAAPALGDGGGVFAAGTIIGVVCSTLAPGNVWDNTMDDCASTN